MDSNQPNITSEDLARRAKSRHPDYRVKALDKKTGLKGDVGAAWKNEDGTISVILNNFISLKQRGNLLITLFPPQTKKG